jgi:rhodanese-related sulfurtransferase/uncharacterized membrane protein YedE/YeeE
MLPLDIGPLGKALNYLVYFAIGLGFGVSLELAGFGNARKLAGQFYFKDMTVLKTMFTAILTACLLIFLTAALGYLDFSKIYVNQTYLWPGIVGGLVMGVGFVVGGYCPGTSIVSAASLKLDGLMFFIGTVIGAGVFGGTVSSMQKFWNSSYTERLLLSDVFGWSLGGAVVAVTVLALVFFYGAEKAEEFARDTSKAPQWRPTNRRYMGAAGVAFGTAMVIWGLGQPTPEEKWTRVGEQYQPLLDGREVFIHPLEYVKTWNDATIKLVTLDLRSKEAFDEFHLDAARNVTFEGLADEKFAFELNQLPPQGVVILIADDEGEAVRAWKRLKVEGVTNLYILEHGLTEWKHTFEPAAHAAHHFDFAKPSAKVLEAFPKDAYTPKIKLKTARRAGGLCG